jgi:hypothetical protein
MKCGQASCACHPDPAARHGPYHALVRVVGGKTRPRYLTAAQAEVAARQVAAGQEFRAHVEAAWEASERWADAELEGLAAATLPARKKGGLRRSSRPRS